MVYRHCSKNWKPDDEQSKADTVPVLMNAQFRGAPIHLYFMGKGMKAHLSNFRIELISGRLGILT